MSPIWQKKPPCAKKEKKDRDSEEMIVCIGLENVIALPRANFYSFVFFL